MLNREQSYNVVDDWWKKCQGIHDKGLHFAKEEWMQKPRVTGFVPDFCEFMRFSGFFRGSLTPC